MWFVSGVGVWGRGVMLLGLGAVNAVRVRGGDGAVRLQGYWEERPEEVARRGGGVTLGSRP